VSIGKEFALLFSVLFLPGLLGQFGTVPSSQFESIVYNLQILVVAIPQIWLMLWLPELNRPGSRAQMGLRRPAPGDLIPAIITSVALIGTSMLAGLILSAFTSLGSAEAPLWEFTRPELLPLILVTMVAVGYREEVFYRAYLFRRAEELDVRPELTVIASSLLFGIGHLYQGVQGLVVTTLLGVVLAAVYLRTRNVHAVAIGHGLYNAAVLFIESTGVAAP
jgi:membrane protease YdiL (CAAX protease family)